MRSGASWNADVANQSKGSSDSRWVVYLWRARLFGTPMFYICIILFLYILNNQHRCIVPWAKMKLVEHQDTGPPLLSGTHNNSTQSPPLWNRPRRLRGEEDLENADPATVICRRAISLSLSPLTDEHGSPISVVMGIASILICGSVCGLLLPKDSKFPSQIYATLSSALGYTYFVAWSVSFYPQVVTNFRRRTTSGLSIEFASLNVLGFACYSIFNVALYCSSTVQGLYRHRYGMEAPIPVQSNDVAFAIHALIISSITLLQILYYDGNRRREMSTFVLVLIGAILVVAIFGAILSSREPSFMNWLDYIYILSVCKIIVTLVKYMPQVVLNWKRRSTIGWVSRFDFTCASLLCCALLLESAFSCTSFMYNLCFITIIFKPIWQILLDMTGGIFSNLQLVLDCVALNDFSGLTGNIPKLLLGQISIVFDIIFCVQHYVLYPSSTPHDESAVPVDSLEFVSFNKEVEVEHMVPLPANQTLQM